jgi:entericidin B
MKFMKSFIVYVLILAFISVFAAGCNTMEGAGKDIQRGGEAIEDAAD